MQLSSLEPTPFIYPLSNAPSPNLALIRPKATVVTGNQWAGNIAVDSDRLITTGPNESIQVWNKQDLSLIHSLEGHPHDDGMDFTIVGDRLITFSTFGLGAKIKIWDLTSGMLLNTSYSYRYYAVDETCLVQANGEWDKETNRTANQTKIWNLSDGSFRCSIGPTVFGDLNPEFVSCIPVLSGDHVITGHRNGAVNVWSKHDGSHVINLAPGNEDRKEIRFLLADGDRVFWTNVQGEVHASHKLDSSIIQTFDQKRDGINSNEFLAITEDLLIGRFEVEKKHFINVWHKENGAFLYSVDCNYTGLAIDANRLVVHVPEQRKVFVFDKRNGSSLMSLEDEGARFLNLRIVDNLLIAGSHENNIQIWDLENGTILASLQGCSPFDIDGSRLIASSKENPSEVLIYDLPTSK